MAVPGMMIGTPQLQMVGAPQAARKTRRPVHTFQVDHRPYQIQPFLLAPVLPGDTLTNALLQTRVVTDPIKNPLVGWWLEYYLFYVPHLAMPRSEEFKSMMLDMSTAVTVDAADADTYHAGETVDWVKQCLQPVVEDFFREDGVAWDAHTLDTVPQAQVVNTSWLDSVRDETTVTQGAEDFPEHQAFPELDASMRLWDAMRNHGMTEMTYEDWIASFGVRAPQAEIEHRPELLRYSRTWSYPTNTVDPTTGTPTSAVSWSIRERADKQRFFKYPGFIFGVTVCRPKVYLSRQRSVASHMLNYGMHWMPAVLRGDTETAAAMGFREFAAADGPLGAGGAAGTTAPTNGYIVDVRDLFLYGDQFHNLSTAATDKNFVALPTAAMQKRYSPSADVDALFEGASPANKVRQDGVANLFIKSWIGDDLIKG